MHGHRFSYDSVEKNTIFLIKEEIERGIVVSVCCKHEYDKASENAAALCDYLCLSGHTKAVDGR